MPNKDIPSKSVTSMWQHLQKGGIGPKGKRSKSVYLGESGMLTISKEFDEEMGNPVYIEIYYDLVAKTLGLVPVDIESETSYKIKRRDTTATPAVTCKRLIMVMPHGRYLVTENLDVDKIILTHAENYYEEY